VYRDSIDALTQLLAHVSGDGEPLEVTDVASISSRLGVLKNGIKHCCVQITFGTGAEYRIEAFGEEAEDLHRKASEHPTFNVCVQYPSS